MDSLKDKLANISMYDVKAYVRKAQNGMDLWLNETTFFIQLAIFVFSIII